MKQSKSEQLTDIVLRESRRFIEGEIFRCNFGKSPWGKSQQRRSPIAVYMDKIIPIGFPALLQQEQYVPWPRASKRNP